MPKNIAKVLFSIFTIISFTLMMSANVYSAGLTLTKIGSLATNGASYSEWWYTGLSPSLEGTANPGEAIRITINGEANAVTTNDSGIWFISTNLNMGDHDVLIESDAEVISFILHTGQTLPDNNGSTGTGTTGNSGNNGSGSSGSNGSSGSSSSTGSGSSSGTGTAQESTTTPEVPETGAGQILGILLSLAALSFGIAYHNDIKNRAYARFERDTMRDL